jgi:MerC mercury resistance protein
MRYKINWDIVGIGTSLACAIHCAVLPLFLTSLPILGLDIISNRAFEFFMIFLAFCIGCYSLLHGFRRHHHKKLPLVLFTIGFIFLVVKSFIPTPVEYWLLGIAVTLIISAHFLNFRYCHRTKECHTHHAH